MTEREFLEEQVRHAGSNLQHELVATKTALAQSADVRRWFRQYPKSTIGVAAGGAVLGGLWITARLLQRRSGTPRSQQRAAAGARAVKTSRMLSAILRPIQRIVFTVALGQLTRFLGAETEKVKTETDAIAGAEAA